MFLFHIHCLLVLTVACFQVVKGQDPYVTDKSMCVFPFTYMGKTYTDCVPSGNNRIFPWCNTNNENNGVWSYCIDYSKSNWVCAESCRVIEKYPRCKATNGKMKVCVEQVIDFSKKPIGNCTQDFSKISIYHTACLPPRANVAKVGITDLDKIQILELHNNYRRNTIVPASRMQKIYWDEELAKVAQSHANRCQFAHDNSRLRSLPGRGRNTGQNIMYITSWGPFVEEFKIMYEAEIIMWTYGAGIKPEFALFGGSAGHYLQLVVEEVSRVGCGYAECVYFNRVDRALVCNYNYPFTAEDELKPYEKGERCSGCPGRCENGLCDCRGKECWNGGTLNLNDCTCKCDPFFTGTKCETPVPAGLDAQGCFFPFFYDNQVYTDCIDWGGGDVWCSTTKYYGIDFNPNIGADKSCVPKSGRRKRDQEDAELEDNEGFSEQKRSGILRQRGRKVNR